MKRHSNGHGSYNNFSNDLERIKAALASVTKHAKGNASKAWYDSFNSVKGKGQDMGDTITTYTKKKPLKSLGIAMLAGLAIGYLLKK